MFNLVSSFRLVTIKKFLKNTVKIKKLFCLKIFTCG